MAKGDTIKTRGQEEELPITETETVQEESGELFIVKFDTPQKKAMIEALITTLGVVTPACQMVRISRWTHYRWLREDELYRRTVEEMGEIALDFAENKLMKAMNSNDIAAIIFYLKTKGKKRGYVERVEFSPHVKPTINMERLSSDERKQLYELLDRAEEQGDE